MTDEEMLEAEKYWCENCCNWDKEQVQMDGYANCKLTGTLAFAQESGKECKCFNVPAENVIVLPCKVGDVVYYITENPCSLSVQANTLYKADVVRIVTTSLGTSLVIQIHNEYGCTEIPDVNEWGKTVFLSVEEFTKRYLDTTDLEKVVEHLTKYKELKEAEQALKGGME